MMNHHPYRSDYAVLKSCKDIEWLCPRECVCKHRDADTLKMTWCPGCQHNSSAFQNKIPSLSWHFYNSVWHFFTTLSQSYRILLLCIDFTTSWYFYYLMILILESIQPYTLNHNHFLSVLQPAFNCFLLTGTNHYILTKSSYHYCTHHSWHCSQVDDT